MSEVDHLLFSLKHDGVSLPVLAAVFESVEREKFEAQVTEAVRSTPTGVYHRRLWYLYEWFSARELPIEGLGSASYVPLLEPDLYFVGREQRRPRHRIIDNLPGNRSFCPLVRRTEELISASNDGLKVQIEQIVASVDRDLLTRALAYIYTKETKSSFEIEHERPNPSRAERFASLLARVDEIKELDITTLTQIQNRIVDPRFAEDGVRRVQNYVGESLGLHREIVHYVPPRPADVPDLMEGLLAAAREQRGQLADPVALAAVLSFGFVFVHPFEDGNGRLHRFLIHQVLASEGVTSPGVIVPVSAVMLARRHEYDACLEAFSRPLMQLIEYELDQSGYIHVENNVARYYRYFDATHLAEALHRWLREAVNEELRSELTFLVGLRDAKAAMGRIVDLPDRLADLFVKLVIGNHGHLAKRKREQFSMLSDEEVVALEEAVRAHVPAPV